MLRIRKYLHCSPLVPGPGLARVALRGLSPGRRDRAPLPSHAAAGGARGCPSTAFAPGAPPQHRGTQCLSMWLPSTRGMSQRRWGCCSSVRCWAVPGTPGCGTRHRLGALSTCGWPAAMGPDPAAHHVPSTCICRGTACGVRLGRGPGAGVGALGARRAAVPGLFACLSRRLRVSSN